MIEYFIKKDLIEIIRVKYNLNGCILSVVFSDLGRDDDSISYVNTCAKAVLFLYEMFQYKDVHHRKD